MNWKFETRKLSEIKPWPKNPRKLNAKGLKDLGKSIAKFGLPEPIVLNTDGTIIGGHARYQVLKQQGEVEAFCALPDKPLDEQELAELNVRLNKNIAGEFDFDILSDKFQVVDLKEWGFEDDFGQAAEPLEEIELVPYKKIHVLISFAPNDYEKVKSQLEKIKKTEGVEYEQSAN